MVATCAPRSAQNLRLMAASRDTPPTPRLDAESEEDALNWNPDELRLRRPRPPGERLQESMCGRASIRRGRGRRAARGLATERLDFRAHRAQPRGAGAADRGAARYAAGEADGVNLADAVMLPVAAVDGTGGDSEGDSSDAASEAAASETAASDDERVRCTTSSDDFVGSDSEAPVEGELASSSSSVAPDDFEDSEEGRRGDSRPAEWHGVRRRRRVPPARPRRPPPARSTGAAFPYVRRWVHSCTLGQTRRTCKPCDRTLLAAPPDAERHPRAQVTRWGRSGQRRALRGRGGRSSRFRHKGQFKSDSWSDYQS